jgi:hypothetical protein
MTLTEDDKVEIKKTLEFKVLQAGRVNFKSSQVSESDDGGRLEVSAFRAVRNSQSQG